MNKKIDDNSQKHDLIEEISNSDLNLANFIGERASRALPTLLSLFKCYKQIPKSIPITEYAKHDPKYQRELSKDGKLSAQSRDDIFTDLVELKNTAFIFHSIDKTTGKSNFATIRPFDYSIEQEGQQCAIRCLALAPSYKQYLNDHNDAVVVLAPPSVQLLESDAARNLAYYICLQLTERAKKNELQAGEPVTLPLQQIAIDKEHEKCTK